MKHTTYKLVSKVLIVTFFVGAGILPIHAQTNQSEGGGEKSIKRLFSKEKQKPPFQQKN